MADAAALQGIKTFHANFCKTLGTVVIGQGEAIDHVCVALLCNGHVLLTGGAATAKGLLVQCVAKAAKLEFKRIQFTPDLMPSDITGTEILEEDASGHRRPRFVPGPIFTNLLMADEINRTPPKTQASLLEGMQEKQVTAGGHTRPLPKPFFVIATKTSVETDGVYPLPEAQQDRFMLNVEMKRLSQAEEVDVVTKDPARNLAAIATVVDGATLTAYQKAARDVNVPTSVQKYIVDLTSASRPGTPHAIDYVKQFVAWGAGVRATQNLALGAKARAAIDGRAAATVDDVKAVALPVLRHRLGINFKAENEGISPAHIVGRLVETIK
ncbi:MAG: AAA family ATPase [Planctomycetota bacterium]|nr:AAA family ATPase [Planctomycetota bacterium]